MSRDAAGQVHEDIATFVCKSVTCSDMRSRDGRFGLAFDVAASQEIAQLCALARHAVEDASLRMVQPDRIGPALEGANAELRVLASRGLLGSLRLCGRRTLPVHHEPKLGAKTSECVECDAPDGHISAGEIPNGSRTSGSAAVSVANHPSELVGKPSRLVTVPYGHDFSADAKHVRINQTRGLHRNPIGTSERIVVEKDNDVS
ncbi:MAG: hypothetical protein QOH00_759 [Gaiellales bacterium]|nr:hypothetical protein [Gaiellales bacterium]